MLSLHRSCQAKQQTQRVFDTLATMTVKYAPNTIAGDPQCSICYTAYEVDELLIVLKCSPLHHYHAACIKVPRVCFCACRPG